MKVKYKNGFEINGITYGWGNDGLYRLPQIIGDRFYGKKKLELIKVGKRDGLLVGGKRKSLSQIESMTKSINLEFEEIKIKK